MTIVIPGMVTISLLSLFYCSMLPETGRKARMQAFERQYIAHRGFHDNRSECPENSLPAFERAIQMGYGIELDVQLTKDGVPVVFHDWDLKRAAGVDRKIRDCTFEELQSYRLFGSSQTIPAFETVLELADGRTPLIIELKAEIVHRELCEKCAVLLDRYPGEYCIESFSPLALGWFKRHRPNVLRGACDQSPRRGIENAGHCAGDAYILYAERILQTGFHCVQLPVQQHASGGNAALFLQM